MDPIGKESAFQNRSVSSPIRCETSLILKDRVLVLNFSLLSDKDFCISDESFYASNETLGTRDEGDRKSNPITVFQSQRKLNRKNCFVVRDTSRSENSLESETNGNSTTKNDGVFEDQKNPEILSNISSTDKRVVSTKTKKSQPIRKKPSPFKCDDCNKTYTSKIRYENHRRIYHTAGNVFNCDDCNKTFTAKILYENHCRFHHTDRNMFKCLICSRCFLRQIARDKHQLSHSNFTCGDCDKSFIRKCDFEIHRRSHTGEKPFMCRFCGTSFTRKRNLDKHWKLMHVPGSLQTCEKCQKQFRSREGLLEHFRTMHRENKFSCSRCAKKFASERNLNRHWKAYPDHVDISEV